MNQRLFLVLPQLRNAPPALGALRHLLVGVLHPDHRYLLGARPADESTDVGDDAVPLGALYKARVRTEITPLLEAPPT